MKHTDVTLLSLYSRELGERSSEARARGHPGETLCLMIRYSAKGSAANPVTNHGTQAGSHAFVSAAPVNLTIGSSACFRPSVCCSYVISWLLDTGPSLFGYLVNARTVLPRIERRASDCKPIAVPAFSLPMQPGRATDHLATAPSSPPPTEPSSFSLFTLSSRSHLTTPGPVSPFSLSQRLSTAHTLSSWPQGSRCLFPVEEDLSCQARYEE